MLIRVGGITAVGKTTIVKRVREIARIEGFPLEIAKTKEILCELAGVKTLKQYRALPEEVRRKQYPEMDRRVYEADRQDPSMIRLYDGHFWFFNSTRGTHQARQIYPSDNTQLLAIAVIVAASDVVYNRRLQDLAIRSDRHWIEREDLATEQKMELKVALAQAAQLSIPIKIFSNNDSKIDAVSEAVLAFVKTCAMKGNG